MQRRWRWALAGAGLAFAIGAVGFSLLGGDSGRANPRDPKLVDLGREVYGRHCLSCHGKDLEGERDWRVPKANGRLPAPPHDESGHTWHHSDRQLFTLTKVGPRAFAGANYQTDMPGFADRLSDREIWAVLAYIKSRWPAKILEYQEEIGGRDR